MHAAASLCATTIPQPTTRLRMSSPPSSASSSDDDTDRFGRLLDIEHADLIALGTRILRDVAVPASPASSASPASCAESRVLKICNGSFNLVYILQLEGDAKMVLRLPIAGKDGSLTGAARNALESQVATMRYIRSNTALPVPEVYHCDPTDGNEILAPYVAMAYVLGVSVGEVWFEAAEGRREENRLRILSQLAGLSALMRGLRFDTLGSLGPDDRVGPCFETEELYDEAADSISTEVKSYGPFLTTEAWFAHLRSRTPVADASNNYGIASAKILDVVLPCLPLIQGERCFALTMPDFGPQNVLVDEHANITGLIDWDDAQTRPIYLAFARYPSWLTRDWDPLMYGWPFSKETEDSPEELQRYRDYYLGELKAALETTPDADACRFTPKAHIFEALHIAVSAPPNATAICGKFAKEAIHLMPHEKRVDGLGENEVAHLWYIGHDGMSNETWEEIQKGLRSLMAVECAVETD
ncbi:APH domain-containing protein [Mycena kentingensis (nom. inval.)]|nr:APH domain-containing protein [Mycena kentingensis (nom. inval.)]